MISGSSWWLLLLAASCTGKSWRTPDGALESVQIDTKVRFIDVNGNEKLDKGILHADEVPFKEPLETEGFYNRPPGAGRYPVRVEQYRAPQRVVGPAIYHIGNNQQKNPHSDGTLDSLEYCKCVSHPDCNPRPNSYSACGPAKFLCCYKRPNKQQNTEFFNEVEDERPMTLPGRETLARPFPPPPGSVLNGLHGSFGPGHDHDSSHIGVFDKPLGTLVGPEGPTGVVGPQTQVYRPSVDGSGSESAQREFLLGPVDPSGLMGSYGRRPVLVGPGGPTGIIGPGTGGRRPNVLVGPGGPTGIIGPGYGRQPTGYIGQGRGVLVGPGGPTGQLGPPRFFG